MNLFSKKLVIGSLSFFSTFAMAADQGAYWGGSLGVGNGDCSDCNIDTGFGMRFFGGYQFNKYFAAEGGFGFVQVTEGGISDYVDAPSTPEITYTQKVFDLSVIASMPLSESFSLFLRGGIAVINLTGEVDFGNSKARLKGGSNPGAIFGLGATYKLANQAKLRFEYTTMGKESYHYDPAYGTDILDTIDASMATVSYQGWF